MKRSRIGEINGKKGITCEAGKVYDLADELARDFIGRGYAVAYGKGADAAPAAAAGKKSG